MRENTKIIAVIDDDASVQKALKRLLRSADYDAESYFSAEEFLESESMQRADCLILDVHLPKMSGIELQARLQETNRRFKIIFISAFSDANARAKAFERGAIAFLPKPLDSDNLLGVLKQALGEEAKP